MALWENFEKALNKLLEQDAQQGRISGRMLMKLLKIFSETSGGFPDKAHWKNSQKYLWNLNQKNVEMNF